MARIHDKNTSKLIKGIEKVIDRQNSKPKKHTIDIGMYTYKIYTNKTHGDLGTLHKFYFPLKWQPLKYVIKRVAHTVYTYEVSALPMGKEAIRRLKRKKKIN
jgi:hypothetical protein